MVNSIFKNIRDKWLNPSNQTSEEADRQSYWTDLILAYNACKRNGITVDKKIIKFEQLVKSPMGDNGSIDVYIKQNNNAIIEQKNWNDNLDLKYKRPVANDKNRKVTPLEQALDYNNGFINDKDKAQYIIISNFTEIRIYDLNNKIYYKKKEIINDSLKPNYVIKLANIGNGSQADKALEAALHGVSIVKKQEIDSHDAAEALDILRLKFIENEQKTMKPSNNKDDVYNDVNKYMKFFSLLCFIFYLDDSECFDNYINNNTYKQYHIFRQLLDTNVSNFKTIMEPLFTWLGAPSDEREELLLHDDYGVYTDDIQMFPFVSKLFNDDIDFPNIDSEMKQAIINCYSSYNWKNVNPVLFGSMMQGLFDDVHNDKNHVKLVKTGKRRQSGIHWTPASYIHKAIDPLIINQLTDKVNGIVNNDANIHDLQELHVELASYRFMDPAAGSGNFITETYLSLRHLENMILIELMRLGYDVNINNDVLINVNKQFGAIELQSECDSIMRLQMQIAYIQSLLELQDMIDGSDFNHSLNIFDELFPLNVDIFKPCIHNALTMDWNDVMPAHSDELLTYSYGIASNNASIDYNLKDTYIIGNPPFIGKRSREQSNELMQAVGKQYYDGYMDYCVGWYYKAADYLMDTHGSMTYVSTSSIVKSSQAVNVWKPLFNDYKLRIKFAHQKQPWSSEANDAAVSIIICSLKHDYDFTKNESCILYDADNNCIECEHINNYLINGDDVYVERTKAPVSKILGTANRGNGITDGGYLILNNDDEIKQAMSDKIIKQHPEYLRDYIVGNDIINSINPPRKILWLVNSTPSDRKKSKFIWNRMQSVIDFRKKSSKKHTQEIAKYPWLFDENRQPSENYLAIPHVFGENRDYMTCDYYSKDVIIGTERYILDPDGFNFSVIESSMMITWVKTVGGQLGEAIEFTPSSTWNTFPMPEINNDDRTAIINAGKRILIARTNNPSILTDDEIKNISMNDLIMILNGERTSTLADLYAKGNMPPQLTKAHDELDSIIDRIIINYAENNENAYKELVKNKKTIDNSTRLHYLFKAYEKMTTE